MTAAPLEVLNAATVAYMKGMARTRCKPFDLNEETVARIRQFRAEVRAEEGGGGLCHIVTEWLQAEYGFERVNVTYLDHTGEVIFTGHVISVLPDGSVLDPTADQIGEGHDVRLLKPDDPEIGRYRPEFFEDYHPLHPDVTDGSLDAWLPFYSGTIDYDRQDQNTDRLGEGWWLEDKEPLLAYLLAQQELASAGYRDNLYDAWLGRKLSRLQDILGVATPRI